MKKKLNLFANSIKLSVLIKPTALIIFLIIIILSTLIMSIPFKFSIGYVEEDYYADIIRLDEVESKEYKMENFKEIGNVITDFANNGLVNECSEINIMLSAANQPIRYNSLSKILERMYVYLVVNGDVFTSEEIANGVQKIFADKKFMQENNLNDGDEIEFLGNKFNIFNNREANRFDRPRFYIPYTAELENFKFLKNPLNKEQPYFYDAGIVFKNLERPLTILERKNLEKLGFAYFFTDWDLIIPLFLLMFVPIVSLVVLNVVISTIYLQKVNGRKYSLYKLLGMPTYFQSGVIFVETSIIAVIGTCIGVLLEYIIHDFFNPIAVFKIEYLAWIYYLLLFMVTLITTLVVVGIKAIKHAKAKPADVKYLS